MGLANIEAMDGYMLTDAVTPRQLAEMANLDYEVAKALYGAYAVDHDEYGEIINGLDDYKVPIYDMFRFLEQEMHDGNITLSGDVQDTLDDLFDQLDEAQKQLQSDDYSRMVVYLNLPEETDETFAFVNRCTTSSANTTPPIRSTLSAIRRAPWTCPAPSARITC